MKNGWLVIKRRLNLESSLNIDTKIHNNIFYLIAALLIIIGLFVEYAYYSTIGHLGSSIASEILKIHVSKFLFILGFGTLIDWVFASLLMRKILSFKEWKIGFLNRSSILFVMILTLMLSFDISISVLCMATIIMTLISFNKKLSFIHPVLIGYLVAVLGTFLVNQNFGIFVTPPMFSAPFMDVVNGPVPLSYDQFLLRFHSISNLLVGMFEGSLAVTLIIPLLICAMFLMKRKMIIIKMMMLYLGTYFLLSTVWLQIAHLDFWILGLVFLNGGILICPIFLFQNINNFPSRFQKGYIIGLGILTFIFTYYYHFVFGPYLALGFSQMLLETIRLIKRFLLNDKNLSHQIF